MLQSPRCRPSAQLGKDSPTLRKPSLSPMDCATLFFKCNLNAQVSHVLIMSGANTPDWGD
jgi:hypothetical protein